GPSALSQQDDQTPAELYANEYKKSYDKKATSMARSQPAATAPSQPIPTDQATSAASQDDLESGIELLANLKSVRP
ncbi:MAG TPA: hypothetical protein PLV25_01980, partial [Opitutales bacterium]|nr:hypothetical protein [Opitutales bacterium]